MEMERNINLIPLWTPSFDSSSSWRLQSDWYSPTRLHSSPVDYNFPGDRFIPNRSLMDLDQAHSRLTSKIKEPGKPHFTVDYRRKMEENLSLDREGKPFKMLVFRGSPKSSRKSRLIDEMRRSDEETFTNTINCTRKFSEKESRILHAPLLKDDYYTNIMDWGKTNVLAVALGHTIYLWNPDNKNPQTLLQVNNLNDFPTTVNWSEDGKTIAVGHLCSDLHLWDAQSCKLIRSLDGHKKRVTAASWNGNILTSGGCDNAIINHDARAKKSLVLRIEAHNSEVCGLKWSRGGNLLASGGNDNHVYLWEASKMSSSHHLHRFTSHVSAVKALAWCPYDFNVLASGGGSNDCCIKFWNVQNGSCINSIDTKAQICGLEWNRHHKEILSGHGYSSYDESKNRICLWRYPSMSKMGETAGHPARILHLCQSMDGTTVISAGADETLRVWEIFGSPQTEHLSHLDSLLSLITSPLR